MLQLHVSETAAASMKRQPAVCLAIVDKPMSDIITPWPQDASRLVPTST